MNTLFPLPPRNEIPMKLWLEKVASRAGVTPHTVWNWAFKRGCIPAPAVRCVNGRRMWVKLPLPAALPARRLRLKEWLAQQGDALGLSPMGVWQRVFNRRTMPAPRLWRVNKRVIYVEAT